MRHLKLFESFDRYEFGEHDPFEYNDIKIKYAQVISYNESMEIEQMFESNGIVIGNYALYESEHEFRKYNTIGFDIKSTDAYVNMIYLGDYCYGVKYNSMMDRDISYLYIVDEVDNIIPTIKLCIEREDKAVKIGGNK